jgi:hypothetical protein
MAPRNIDAKLPVNLYLHPNDAKALNRAGPGRKSQMVALALKVLALAPIDLLDKARAELAKRDAA